MGSSNRKSRAQQAEETKKRIIKQGKKLIIKNGYEKISVDEISKAADVTVGTFYYYFKSKFDLIMEFLPKVEDYFSGSYYKKHEEDTSYRKIIDYFSYFNTEIEKKTPVEVISKIYTNPEALANLGTDRIMPGVELIIEGQIRKEITKEYQAMYIAQILFSASRGVCQLWSSMPESFSLSEATRDIMTRLVYGFSLEKSKDYNKFSNKLQ
ncbi:TetR/AcrR family transcriptional regulator [Eubacterium oxidoreducens]|uniref:Transcriptional regulator, TetR family n=1 Tax=Eubacterium oxidoreducens TaxID=1732 RepID=A0A1G6C7I2_EUBOX|nr:TetR/AcrR family transcriptional regulator [Eubacterium oxidoreducens]SDB28772.1 transcriptional regulator, TetR family [Eubacterium oxidoreducens]